MPPPGPIPNGQGEGTAIIAPGTAVSDTIARFVHLFSWKGKVFEPDAIDPQRATLKNRLLSAGDKSHHRPSLSRRELARRKGVHRPRLFAYFDRRAVDSR